MQGHTEHQADPWGAHVQPKPHTLTICAIFIILPPTPELRQKGAHTGWARGFRDLAGVGAGAWPKGYLVFLKFLEEIRL